MDRITSIFSRNKNVEGENYTKAHEGFSADNMKWNEEKKRWEFFDESASEEEDLPPPPGKEDKKDEKSSENTEKKDENGNENNEKKDDQNDEKPTPGPAAIGKKDISDSLFKPSSGVLDRKKKN